MLIYGGKEHVCMASLSKQAYEHTVVVNGLSKAFSMTGWRIGYSAAPAELAKGISAIQGHTTSNSATFTQWAAITALRDVALSDRDVLRGVKKAGRHLAMLADFGAEGGSRTLARVFKPPTPLAGEPLRPLGYFCRTI